MIQANELRIGNILKYNTDHMNTMYPKFYWKVTNIGVKSFKCKGHSGSNFEPIRLSEEILFNCGFELVDENGDCKDFSISGFDYYVGIDHQDVRFDYVTKNGCYCVFYDDESLQYLHQLQNLYFALTGSELDTSKLL